MNNFIVSSKKDATAVRSSIKLAELLWVCLVEESHSFLGINNLQSRKRSNLLFIDSGPSGFSFRTAPVSNSVNSAKLLPLDNMNLITDSVTRDRNDATFSSVL